MKRADKALKSLYGAPDAARPQEVFTPPGLVAPLVSVWGGIALDPCAHHDSPTSSLAVERWYGSPTEWDDDMVPTAWDGFGLTSAWKDRTYCNPPFGQLRKWLEHSAGMCDIRQAVLMPARLQRPWLRSYLRGRCVIALNSICFVGHRQAFPQAVLMVISGHDAWLAGGMYEALGLGNEI